MDVDDVQLDIDRRSGADPLHEIVDGLQRRVASFADEQASIVDQDDVPGLVSSEGGLEFS
jgi:hypothetical protein